ncbi:MAG: RES family NAD+ phosphorylase [Actinomycetota bacterium]|nr:RES family NAD+ phosphorylase [Actinomycetota bacterium]
MSAATGSLHRIFRWRDPWTGEEREPFFFASAATADSTGGRYDLPLPHGACYCADTKAGAWLETFRSVGLVALPDVQARRLLTTRPPRPIRAADLLAAGARRYGVTNDIHTGDDYGVPRQWALRLFQAGFRALRGRIRHDPTGRSVSVTLLDAAGGHQPFGWRWRRQISRLEDDVDLLVALRRYGTGIAGLPIDVIVEEPG